MDDLVKQACALLDEQQAIAFATIIRQQGSSPRMAGTRMLVGEGGQTFGTIGGGILEAKVIGAAREVMRDGSPQIWHFDLSGEDVAAMGMVCGGEVRVLLEPILPAGESRMLVSMWSEALSHGKRAALVTCIEQSAPATTRMTHALMGEEGLIHGELSLSPEARQRLTAQVKSGRGIEVETIEGCVVVCDAGPVRPAFFIFGAGHVAQPTAKIAALSGFQVAVLDDRADFASETRFPEASAVAVLPDFSEAFNALSIDENTYILIVTRGHLHDRQVLAQALKTPALYIGMIGSRRKRAAIYGQLLKEGFTQRDLDRVHSPVGLAIGAETPEEIAVSIVAEMIGVRRRPKKETDA